MKAARAEFQAPPAPWAAAWVLAVAVMLLAAWQVFHALAERERVQQARQAQAERAAEQAALSRPKPPSAPPPYEASARRLFNERGALWPAALRALEQTVTGAITVVSIDHSAAEGSLRVEASAPDHAAAVALLEALNAGNSGRSDEVQWVLVRSSAGAGDAALTGAKVLLLARRESGTPLAKR